jgi:hypothetical protein
MHVHSHRAREWTEKKEGKGNRERKMNRKKGERPFLALFTEEI